MKAQTVLALLATAMAIPAAAQDLPMAQATFLDLQGAEVGSATLQETPEGVRITGEIRGMPAGEHGFHVHQTGNCDPTTQFESAGEHFEPGTRKHGTENPEGPHAGDIVNQSAGEDGVVTLDATTTLISLTEGETNVFDTDGSALVLHADPDDYTTDPSGNSGDRIACGVIEAMPAQ